MAGARVAVAARRADKLEALVAEIAAAGGQARAFAMDVEDEASVIAGYDAVEAAFGPPDSVIANAGISLQGSALDIGIDDFDKVLAVNTRGVFLTAREGARRMIGAGSPDSERGRILLVASIGAHKVLPGLTAYVTSKAATAHMGKSLAREWARKGINVNVLCPGYIKTELNDDWFESEGGQKLVATFPRKRLMETSDLEALALYLTSDAARAVTGSVFTVDDGQSL
jgi:NAD(P)-dependent dehydrogenase (short-subunit alcohol dehydrogenase family)